MSNINILSKKMSVSRYQNSEIKKFFNQEQRRATENLISVTLDARNGIKRTKNSVEQNDTQLKFKPFIN